MSLSIIQPKMKLISLIPKELQNKPIIPYLQNLQAISHHNPRTSKPRALKNRAQLESLLQKPEMIFLKLLIEENPDLAKCTIMPNFTIFDAIVQLVYKEIKISSNKLNDFIALHQHVMDDVTFGNMLNLLCFIELIDELHQYQYQYTQFTQEQNDRCNTIIDSIKKYLQGDVTTRYIFLHLPRREFQDWISGISNMRLATIHPASVSDEFSPPSETPKTSCQNSTPQSSKMKIFLTVLLFILLPIITGLYFAFRGLYEDKICREKVLY